MYKYINNKTTLNNKFGFFLKFFLLRCIEYFVENMKLKIKKKTIVHVCTYIYIHIYMHVFLNYILFFNKKSN
jgi:hypothetical protein